MKSFLFRISFAAVTVLGASQPAWADVSEARRALQDSQSFYHSGQYFKAARYAFSASEADPALKAEAYSWVTLGLIRAGLYNSASYFFIRTLQLGNRPAIRRALTQTQNILLKTGGDLLRPYLLKHTAAEDYDEINRSALLYSLGKDALLKGNEEKAVNYLSHMSSQSPLWPYGLQLRGSAQAILGRADGAIADFQACADQASDFADDRDQKANAFDLRARCLAGVARTYYQQDRFADADRAYDRIPKASIVWPDILFEQAWNSFGKQEYNRSLGKLVSYKSPALSFVFNSEADVLRAQSYLALCLYDDANSVINEFNGKYTRMGEEIKHFVERNSSNLQAFYDFGKEALAAPLHTKNDTYRMANRFIRGPYFQSMVATERAIETERAAIQRFDSMQPGVRHGQSGGFPGFLNLVLGWRAKSIRLLGGAFVKNSLVDYHQILISDFEKMAFIKLEMLGRAKDRLVYKRPASGERSRGNVAPSRRDDQYYWSFNGEFWNDELGDYVFGLESECRG